MLAALIPVCRYVQCVSLGVDHLPGSSNKMVLILLKHYLATTKNTFIKTKLAITHGNTRYGATVNIASGNKF